MKKHNYLFDLNELKSADKFNILFESIMSDTEIYKNIDSSNLPPISDKKLQLIMQQIEKPQYVVCESTGDCILLEEAIFMDEDFLITEGILDKVKEKIQKIIDWIKQGIKNVLSKSSDMIKAFCQKVKNNAVVAAIRKKLGLDDKLKTQNFKNYIKITKIKTTEESISNNSSKFIITEKTKLSKKEQQLTDPKQIENYIKKYQDALSGKKILKNAKTGNPLSKKYLRERLKLFKDKLASVEAKKPEDKKPENEKTENKKPTYTYIKPKYTIGGNGEKKTSTDNKEVSSENAIGCVYFKVDGMKDYIDSVKKESVSQNAIDAAASATSLKIEDNVVADGGKSEEKKKKGLFNKIGNKMKDKLSSTGQKIKKWFSAQNVLVKILIYAIIAVLAILAIYLLITTVIWPILYSIIHGGVINAAVGVFRVYASGKTFVSTYKQGKKSWQSGQGWGKTFLMIGLSILAVVNLGQMAAKGSAMMAADQAASGGAEAAQSGAQEAGSNTTSKLSDSKVPSDQEVTSKHFSEGMTDKSSSTTDISNATASSNGGVTPDQLDAAKKLFNSHPEKFMPEDMQQTLKISRLKPMEHPDMVEKIQKAQQAVEKWKQANPFSYHATGSDLRMSDMAKKALNMVKSK